MKIPWYNFRMRRRRGIILIMALFIVLVMGMVGRAIVAGGPANLQMALQTARDLAARRACEAGVSYARLRLRENPDWKGDGNALVVDRPDLKVLEDNGNVFGLITDSEGQKSQFRLRFNYQDGADGGDGLDDPGPGHFVDNIYVSANNLSGPNDLALPRAQNASPFIAVPLATASPGPGPPPPLDPDAVLLLPKGSAAILVEGRTGRGTLDMSHPDDLPSGGQLTTRVVQVVLSEAVDLGVPDASVMAGGDFLAETTNGVTDSIVGLGTPRLRSKGSVKVVNSEHTAPNRLQMNGELSFDRNQGLTAHLNGSVTQVQESVGDSKDFYRLKWSDVVQADASPTSTTAVQIPGGTYVFWEDHSLHYFDMSLADYKTYIAANPTATGQTLSSNLSEVRSSTNLSSVPGGINVDHRTGNLNVSKDLAVVSSVSGVDSICITPREGHPLTPTDTTYNLSSSPDEQYSQHPTITLANSTFSTQSDMVLLCDVAANNSTLTSAGSAVIASTSVVWNTSTPPPPSGGGGGGGGGGHGGHGGFHGGPPPPPPPSYLPQSTQNQGLSMYVKKNLTVSTWQPAPVDYVGTLGNVPFSAFGDLRLDGLVYCWGDFTGYAGVPGTRDVDNAYGDLSVQGALVAYGADPGTGQPGSAGNGKVTMYARGVDLKYDSARLAGTTLTSTAIKTLRRGSYDFNP